MKKVVSLKCPNCGASLKVNEKDKNYKCTHCDSELLIEKDLDDELKAVNIENMKKNGKLSRAVILYFILSSIFAFIVFILFFIIGVVFIGKENRKEIKETKVEDYNFTFVGANGTNPGVMIKITLDDVITKNKVYKDHKVTVIYNDIKTTKEDDIIKIKDKLGELTYYEVKIDYDKDGYASVVTILDKD